MINGQGRPSPKANDPFSPVSDFAPISENFSESVQNLTSIKTNFCVCPLKFLMTFSLKICHSSYFHRIETFSPISDKTYFPSVFTFPLFSFNLCIFLIIYLFLFPHILTTMHFCIRQRCIDASGNSALMHQAIVHRCIRQ